MRKSILIYFYIYTSLYGMNIHFANKKRESQADSDRKSEFCKFTECMRERV